MALPAPSLTSPLESDPPGSPAQGSACLNCGTQLSDTFCAHCGQRAGDVHLSVRDLIHELAAEHFGLDTKVARTLVALMRYPGRLTREFLAGRRIRYLPPLRLYLSLSVIYFLASAIASDAGLNNGAGVVHINTSTSAAQKSHGVVSFDTNAANLSQVGEALDSAGIRPQDASDIIGDTLHGNTVVRFVKRRSAERTAYLMTHKAEAIQQISERFHHELPDALFLLVPGLALALFVLYRSSKRYYSEHLVFALHFQAFAFVALTIGLIPYLGALANIAIFVYLFLALRHVYGQSITATMAKLVVIVIGYGISLTLIMAAVGATAFLFA